MRRVEEIRKFSRADKWNHCPGVLNPADLATRGVPAVQLNKNMLWWTGPDFIKSRVIACEESSNESPLEKEVLEEEIKPPTKITHIFVLPQEEIVTPYQSLEAVMDCKNFSNLQHLIRVTCYVFRFIRNVKCRAKENVDVLPANRILTTEEIVNAKNRWIRTVQLSEFAKKFENISARIVLNYIRQFGLYIDQWGILRCKGRIGNANIPSETANPVLLPTHHHLTTLVIKEVHAKTMHGGVASTLTAIRDNYWIPRGREIVKSVVRRCIVCTRYNAKPFPLFTPPSLPHSRVDDGPPWTNTGVESVVNSRPLTYVYDDVDGTSYALSPAHLIYGRRISGDQNQECYEVVSTHESLTKKARHHRQLLRQFTKRWRREYLTSLRENARKVNTKEPHVKVGDLVILKNDGTARCFWKIAKIVKLIEGKDGKIRAAEIRVMGSNENRSAITLKRPLQLLIPTEIKAKEDESKDRELSEKTKLNPNAKVFLPNRARREAAVAGEIKRRFTNS